MSKRIMVGRVPVGGGAPVSIQSMCSTKTHDVEATVEQILRLEEAGCEIIRVAVPDMAAAKAVGPIRSRIHARVTNWQGQRKPHTGEPPSPRAYLR